jgi:class 3 adenylate cyclase/tetratricopeptide (TPR) repeat protein
VTICASCGAENADAARFCVRCGAALATCERCGAELPAGVNFCPACGHRVSMPVPVGEERKRVTILFADLAGSTPLGEQLDPERLREVMDSFFGAMRREIEAEGGTVEKYIGDAVVAVFGVPTAHEDDPTRALRAALRMRRGLEHLNRSLEDTHALRLAMRIGVNTGEVIARVQPGPGEGFVTGDAVNVAARLEQGADPGQILVGERTARGARGVRFTELGPLPLKGKQTEVRAYELLDEDVAEPRTAQRSDSRLHRTPMVGRGTELTMVKSVFDRCVADRRPHLVTVYGDAGVGKTRLVEEFATWTADLPQAPVVISGRCLSYGEGVTYWPLGEILKAHAGILDTDPPELAIEKIRKVGDELLTADVSADPARASAALAQTIALEDPDASLAGSDPREVRDNLHAAWRSFFSALARSSPVLVIVEDIHWADPALLDLLEDAADRSEGPLLFLCPARPELTARRPEWGGGRWNHSSLLLEPLSASDSSHLLDLLVEGGAVSSDLRTLILERAGGNPFFLEEIVQRLLDEPAGVEYLDIPDTVQGVLAARIDLLTPVEKLVLESASVVGRTFWNGAVASLLEPAPDPLELDDVLWRLEDRGLVHGRIGSTIVGEREFSFRHVLIKDVAYESLPRRDRGKAHARVAGWIEAQTKDREREFAELLAHHYEHAYQAIAGETRPDPEEVERLRERAFRFALTAANEAGSKLALEQADRFAATALSLAAGPSERSRALETLGMAAFHAYEGDRAWASFKEAIDLLTGGSAGDPASGDPRSLARLCALALEIVTRAPGTMRHRIARAEGERYLEIGLSAAGPEDSEERARLLVARSFAPDSFREAWEDDAELERAVATGEEAAAMARRLGRVDLESAALDGITSAHQSLGRYGPMEDPIRRRLELAPKLTDPYEVGDIHAMAAWWALSTGRYREAVELADRGFTGAMPGSPVQALYCVDFRAAARFRLGDWDGVLADVEVAEELMGERRETPPGFAAMHLAIAAFVHDAQGDRDAASRYLQLLRWLEHAEDRLDTVVILWQARLLARRGEYAAARALLERPEVADDRRGRDEILEAWCEVVSEEGSWAQAAELAERAAQHAERAGEPPLALYAMRLDGRAAAALGASERASELLGSVADAFTGLEAAWEAAATRLDLARVLVDLGHDDRATDVARAIVPVFERIRSVRELRATLDLIDRSA